MVSCSEHSVVLPGCALKLCGNVGACFLVGAGTLLLGRL